MRILLILPVLLIFLSCEDSPVDVNSIKYLDIENAQGIVLGKYTSRQDTTYKFFKFTSSDNLEEVKYLGAAKVETYSDRIPVSIYDINSDYFLANFKYGDPEKLESYLVRRFDGQVQKLDEIVIPEKSGHPDSNEECFVHDKSANHYFMNASGSWKLNLNNPLSPLLSQILTGEDLSVFCSDYMGNLMTKNKVYLVNGTTTALDNAPVIPVNSFINQMYYLFRKGDSIQAVQLDISTGTISERKLMKAFKLTEEEAALIGSNAFGDAGKIMVVMSKAIFQITGTAITQLDLTKFNLKTVLSCRFSNKYCFIYGEDPIGQKVFVRLDPSAANTVYTQVLAPNLVVINQFSVSSEGNILFSAIRINDSKKIFGFIPFNANNHIIDDDIGVTEKQLLAK